MGWKVRKSSNFTFIALAAFIGMGALATKSALASSQDEGPYKTKSSSIVGGTWLKQVLVYPDPETIHRSQKNSFPIVVISHGNGHNYKYYSYLQKHLASWGYLTMSHTNQTGPGIETASTTTLTYTDHLLSELSKIEDGKLKDLVDASHIAWIGHSRGGEGVVRAYTRILDGYQNKHYTIEQIKVISSIAPTTFYSATKVDPKSVPYHMFVGGADGDVNGSPRRVVMSMPIYERAMGEKQLTYVQAAGHNVFNDQSRDEGSGPNRLKRADVHQIAKGYYLALLNIHLKGDQKFREYFAKHSTRLRPRGVAPTVQISNEYKLSSIKKWVVDDFQTNPQIETASSDAKIVTNVSNITENILQDGDQNFRYLDSDPMNGMTRYIDQIEVPKGAIFDWEGENYYWTYELKSSQDVSNYRLFSLRAAQGSRHPLTLKLNNHLAFAITLEDQSGNESSVSTTEFGSILKPYPRQGGWANEFNTIRIPLEQFIKVNPRLDLRAITKVGLYFGSNYGSAMGRLAIDDIEFLEQ